MGYWVLRYFTYAFLVVGVMYMSWHMGRSFERAGAEEVMLTTCTEFEENLDCTSLRVEVRDFKRVYEEVLDELQEPKPKSYWDGKYTEFTKR